MGCHALSAVLLKICCCSPLSYPIQCENPGEIIIMGTSVQYCRWGGGRGWVVIVAFEQDCFFAMCEKVPHCKFVARPFVHDCRIDLLKA